jgi:hypothetical protein
MAFSMERKGGIQYTTILHGREEALVGCWFEVSYGG